MIGIIPWLDLDRPPAGREPMTALTVDDERAIGNGGAPGLSQSGLRGLTVPSADAERSVRVGRPDTGVIPTAGAKGEEALSANRAPVFGLVSGPFGTRQIRETWARAFESIRIRWPHRNGTARTSRVGAAGRRPSRHSAETIAELRRMADELAVSQRIRDDIMAVVSHELRTPLVAVIEHAEIVRHSPDASRDAIREWVAVIEASGRKLLSMINDALDIVAYDQGLRRGAARRIDVSALLGRVVEGCRPDAMARDRRILLDAQPGLFVMADPNGLAVASRHLIDNAIRASPEGGTVEVTAWRSDVAVSLLVGDRGPGVAGTIQRQPGPPFSQTDMSLSRGWQGLGLGLAVTGRFSRENKGRFTLTPRQGGGTLALIELPPSDTGR